MPKISIRIGDFTLYLWAGSWNWLPESLDCGGHCKNLLGGP